MTAGLLAPAKVNLFLHVGAPDPEGFHPLVSLMAFADIGDRLTARPAAGLSLSVQGPFAAGLSAGEDNLVLRAVRALAGRCGVAEPGIALALDKKLPLASGLGGGSSDAGAALRLANDVLGLGQPDSVLETLAAELGSDGAACLRARLVMAQGRGQRLSPGPVWPDLPCVLVNPGAPSPTGAVYRAYDGPGLFSDLAVPELSATASVEAAARALSRLHNDLQAPAIALQPRIGAVLDALAAQPETLLARMSGSGATCFALCADAGGATALASRLAERCPGWWVARCTLRGR